MVETTKKERMKVGRIWRDLNNFFRDRNIDHITEPRNLTSITKFAEVGRKGFGINFGKWRASPVEDRLVVLLHEITHKLHGGSWGHNNHQPDFWKEYMCVYRDAYDHKDKVEQIFGAELDWRAVDFYMLDEVSGSTDERIETPVERKKKMIPKLVTPDQSFSATKIILDYFGDIDPDLDTYSRVKFHKVDYQRNHSFSELENKLAEDPSKHPWFVDKRQKDDTNSQVGGTWYWVEPPKVKKKGDRYEVVDFNIVMEMMEERGMRKIYVEPV